MSLNIADGQRVRVWGVFEDKGKFAVVKLGSSRKDKKSEEYVASDWLANFVGKAYEKLQDLEIPDKGGVTIFLKGATFAKEKYTDKNGDVQYAKTPKFTVFNFSESEDEPAESSKKSSAKKTSHPKFEQDDDEPFSNEVEDKEEELPF